MFLGLAAAVLASSIITPAGPPGFFYVSAFDNTPSSVEWVMITPTDQSNLHAPAHSLTEIAVLNNGMVAEVGSTSDPGLNNGDAVHPHLFVSAWTNQAQNQWVGYNQNSGFVSTVSDLKPGDALTVGQAKWFGFDFYQGNIWVYADHEWIGYFPGSEWNGNFTKSMVTDVYGETYYNGTNYPTMNGTVSNYQTDTGGKFGASPLVQSPYGISNYTPTGFSTSGGGFDG